MKRPDGWDELYLEAYRREYSGEGHGSPERAMFEAGADAQAKMIYEWGNEDCKKHPYTSRSAGEAYNRKRHRCPECWQELLEEVE